MIARNGKEATLPSAPSSVPKRGEVWKVSFDPTVGAEIRKTRPAMVISSDAVGRLPIKLVVPVTVWKPAFAPNIEQDVVLR